MDRRVSSPRSFSFKSPRCRSWQGGRSCAPVKACTARELSIARVGVLYPEVRRWPRIPRSTPEMVTKQRDESGLMTRADSAFAGAPASSASHAARSARWSRPGVGGQDTDTSAAPGTIFGLRHRKDHQEPRLSVPTPRRTRTHQIKQEQRRGRGPGGGWQ
jgi:hypothetical protein